MQLTQSDILCMMEEFSACARRVQEIKDSMLYLRFFGNEEELASLEGECEQFDVWMGEMRALYHGRMLPLVERAAEFLAAHPEELA